MNIFVLDDNIELCAQYHCNQHVVKMVTESAQLLSTACRISGQDVGYQVAHKNHPCAIWARENVSNWKWLLKLTELLNEEYKFRYEKDVNHKGYEVAASLPVPNIPEGEMTPHPLCMPDEYKTNDCVESYRNFYNYDKSRFAQWKNRSMPSWFVNRSTDV